MSRSTLFWFRLDLRLADNPGLIAALARGGPVVPVYLWAPAEEGDWPPGAASKWWLHHSLAALDGRLRSAGSRLIIRRGPVLAALTQLVKETNAKAVYWNRRYEPALLARDSKLSGCLRDSGVETQSFNAHLLHEPGSILNQSGQPFRVFSAFWRHCLRTPGPAQLSRDPSRIPGPPVWPASLPVSALELEPKQNWAGGLAAEWTPGEKGAGEKLTVFSSGPLDGYDHSRDLPALRGTSRLSPHLHFGEISPRQAWEGLGKWREGTQRARTDVRSSRFFTELGWREFAHHLLYHYPKTTNEPLREEFSDFPWHSDAKALKAWQRGRTGYPIVDSGMRELWTTGWMHNRVRMIVASFLVKDLLVPWQEGARWFWDTLVDADLAQNTLGWQWTSGCGADAAPFFRIFNPVSQGEKFDPDGRYVRHWCPELARLPAKWIHKPHEAPSGVLHAAGVQLGTSYPRPIVSHGIAREVALEAFQRLVRLKRTKQNKP